MIAGTPNWTMGVLSEREMEAQCFVQRGDLRCV